MKAMFSILRLKLPHQESYFGHSVSFPSHGVKHFVRCGLRVGKCWTTLIQIKAGYYLTDHLVYRIISWLFILNTETLYSLREEVSARLEWEWYNYFPQKTILGLLCFYSCLSLLPVLPEDLPAVLPDVI